MASIDIAILVIIGISAIFGAFRGFTRELLSLAAWLVAFGVSYYFSADVTAWLTPYIDGKSLRLVVSFLALFLTTLIVAWLLIFLIGKLVKASGLSGTDRAIGAVFGLIRGCLLVLALVLLAGFTNLPQDGWWKESMFLDYFESVALWSKTFLSADIAVRIRY